MACIWYLSKYVAPPAKASAGGRGYLIMCELARMGHRCVVITSDSNMLTEVPKLEEAYLRQDVDGLELWWVRTLKYQFAKSSRRILSWLDFEWRLWRMPKASLPRPDANHCFQSVSADNPQWLSAASPVQVPPGLRDPRYLAAYDR